jgi:hypothetical protein
MILGFQDIPSPIKKFLNPPAGPPALGILEDEITVGHRNVKNLAMGIIKFLC